jgi:hypothetical protein
MSHMKKSGRGRRQSAAVRRGHGLSLDARRAALHHVHHFLQREL